MPIQLLPNIFLSLQTSNLEVFQPGLIFLSLVGSCFLSCFMHFIHLDLGLGFFCKIFGVFQNCWVICEIFGGVMFKWSYMLMHCITFAFSQCFMHFRCVLCILEPCVQVGLDWAEPMIFLLLHVTCSCIRTILFFPLILLLIGTFLVLSLSLSLG